MLNSKVYTIIAGICSVIPRHDLDLKEEDTKQYAFFILIFFHMFKISFKICMKQTLIGNITSIWNLCKMSSPNTINPFSDIFFSGLVNTNDQH